MPAALLAQGPAPAPAVGAAGRPLPQSSVPPSGSGPFLRYARASSRPGYARSGDAVANTVITNPLAAAPGYIRYLDVTVVASGGSGTTTAAVAAADAPANVVNIVQFKDPWGTPLITGDGYSILKLLAVYGGQGLSPLSPGSLFSNYPSYSAIASTGNFTFHTIIPVEGTKGYGVISIGNSSVLPSLYMSTTTGVFSTQPAPTVPTLATTVDEFYYDIDPSNPAVPPGNGSTFQTAVVVANQPIAQSSNTRVQLPRTGGYLTSLILVLRDTTNARQDGFNTTGRVRVYIDGVPRFDETFNQLQDRMYAMSGGIARDSGVAAYSFKLSLSQLNLGLLDTLEQALQTNPGTLIEVEATPWGSGGSGSYTMQAIITQLVPSGPIAQGLPEV